MRIVEELIEIWPNEVCDRLPESIVFDRGVQFAAEMMKELNSLLGVQTKPSAAYYPQTDDQIERINQELKQYSRVFIDH